jgi:hypothetical protein
LPPIVARGAKGEALYSAQALDAWAAARRFRVEDDWRAERM